MNGAVLMGNLWRLDLICCGHTDGHVVRETWDEADQFRRDYTTGSHDRSAILSQDFAHAAFCNGYSEGCPLRAGSFLDLRTDR